MKYYGVTEYWKVYTAKQYRGTPLKTFIVFVLFGILFSLDYMGGKFDGLSPIMIGSMAILPVVFGVLASEFGYYSLTKDDHCYLIGRGIRYFNSESRDKDTKIYAYLELKEKSFVLNGIFQDIRYFFITNEISYREIVDINTDFNETFEIKVNIFNNESRRELITLDIYNMYFIDNEGMRYFYDNWCKYKK